MSSVGISDTLSVKKRLRDHLVLAGHYEKKPDYVKLAKGIHKRHKSVLGDKKVIKKFEMEQLYG